MKLTAAPASRLPAVRRLLRSAALPEADLTPGHLGNFLIAGDDEVLEACVGLERFRDAALLRSLCVGAAGRGQGRGTAALVAIESHARSIGVRKLYLLTTTAAGFFAARGYEPCERSAVPPEIRATSEFASLCPASAACLRKEIS